MNEQRIWLITSLFCDKIHWNILLNKEVKVFIENMEKEFYFHSCYLELNYLEGENIRFAFLVDRERAEDLAKETDLYFRTFFSNCDFPSKHLPLPVDSIFLPFPPNSIQYGLYTMPKAITRISSGFILGLSDIVIDALSENEIDDETIFTFSLYQYLGWIKTALLFNNDDITTKVLNQFSINPELIQVEELTADAIKEKFETNKEMVQEIFFDIFDFEFQKNYDRIPAWSQKWIELCMQQLKDSADDSFNSFFLIPQIVNKQLGFNGKMSTLLNYIIGRTLSQNGMTLEVI